MYLILYFEAGSSDIDFQTSNFTLNDQIILKIVSESYNQNQFTIQKYQLITMINSPKIYHFNCSVLDRLKAKKSLD